MEILQESRLRCPSLEFDEARHQYKIDGQPLISVTTVVESLSHPFDAEYQSERIAIIRGGTAEEWRAKWERNRDFAAARGSVVHRHMEHMAKLLPGEPTYYHTCNPMAEPYIVAGYDWLRLARDHDLGQGGAITELRIGNAELGLAGTIDLLAATPKGIVIVDYKTSSNISRDSYGRFMLSPIDSVPDANYFHYVLQLSLYQLLLEKMGLAIAGRVLVWLRPDRTWKVFQLPHLSREASDLASTVACCFGN